jgi:Mg-chelatase subunit ChlI
MSSFKSAFAAARKAGKKIFTWNGKRYNTKLASDKKQTAVPTKNPRKNKANPKVSRKPSSKKKVAAKKSTDNRRSESAKQKKKNDTRKRVNKQMNTIRKERANGKRVGRRQAPSRGR